MRAGVTQKREKGGFVLGGGGGGGGGGGWMVASNLHGYRVAAGGLPTYMQTNITKLSNCILVTLAPSQTQFAHTR